MGYALSGTGLAYAATSACPPQCGVLGWRSGLAHGRAASLCAMREPEHPQAPTPPPRPDHPRPAPLLWPHGGRPGQSILLLLEGEEEEEEQQQQGVGCYGSATRCPVLTYPMPLPGRARRLPRYRTSLRAV
eukprot:755473-Rhodomonas_salina.1